MPDLRVDHRLDGNRLLVGAWGDRAAGVSGGLQLRLVVGAGCSRSNAQRERFEKLRARAQAEPVTVLYATRDREHNNAVVLAELLWAGES